MTVGASRSSLRAGRVAELSTRNVPNEDDASRTRGEHNTPHTNEITVIVVQVSKRAMLAEHKSCGESAHSIAWFIPMLTRDSRKVGSE